MTAAKPNNLAQLRAANALYETRRKNLSLLRDLYGSIANLNTLTGRNRQSSSFSQILNSQFNKRTGRFRDMVDILTALKDGDSLLRR